MFTVGFVLRKASFGDINMPTPDPLTQELHPERQKYSAAFQGLFRRDQDTESLDQGLSG